MFLDQKLKVSIAEWDTHNRITGRIVAHHIAHALGIKLDYTKAPNEPPGFKGFSDRYDSQGNSCTNISGLMDQGYKTEVDKFTTCSKEDYKAYYNKVRQTHRSFCLDCSKYNIFQHSFFAKRRQTLFNVSKFSLITYYVQPMTIQ